jgi:hypothetical protein
MRTRDRQLGFRHPYTSRAFQGEIIDGVPRAAHPLLLRVNRRRGGRYVTGGA